ncbi:hypothetical protein [Actinomycetospora chibensis]|uniref:Uncharacterized protein n=1 Tax=Actinomycetospora chibensis TaxID=663606 RepID=A0ABV9RE31_9PSEU|nr:hypothetical protein [Actinomycetospora chibensis]MDD7927159.1 hypothetical protein [Actinomycetospora chibensis]
MVERTATTPARSDEHAATRVRAAIYGTVIAVSVLAYLGDHEPGPWVTALTVAGTGIVIFLAEAYTEVVGRAYTGVAARLAHELRAALQRSAWAAVPGLVAGVVLLVLALLRIDLSTRIDITLWVGVAALAVCSALAGRATHRRPVVRVAWTVASILVGSTIVALKAALH